MSSTRDTRLVEDQKKLEKLAAACDYLQVEPIRGNPPTEYLLTFKLNGYVDSSGKVSKTHKVRLTLPAGYPISDWPAFHFDKGLWHPNVYTSGDVCLGFSSSRWKPGFRIDELVIDIAKFICFKEDSYNLNSPANGGCSSSWISSHTIPVDSTNVLPRNIHGIRIKEKPKISIKVKEKPKKKDIIVKVKK